MVFESPTLCFPDTEKACFACCPPIRPAGYEHIQHLNIVRRILRENSQAFKDAEGIIPITGFSCWALGYTDRYHRLVGCLLHPAQNGGADLRYRTGYGEKCKREVCPEAKVFSELESREKMFWLQLTDGLNAFSYSSRNHNPLFKMMNWGQYLLKLIPHHEQYKAFTTESFFQSYPFFSSRRAPKADVYMIKWLIEREGPRVLKGKTFLSEFEVFSGKISKELHQGEQKSNRPLPASVKGTRRRDFTHLLDLDPDFLDFLRISARITKITQEDALALKRLVDDELEGFRSNLH